jgi:hypothetical protein
MDEVWRDNQKAGNAGREEKP